MKKLKNPAIYLQHLPDCFLENCPSTDESDISLKQMLLNPSVTYDHKRNSVPS